jgi:hypothetical protein
VVDAVNAANDPAFGWTGTRLAEALQCLERTTEWLLAELRDNVDRALAGATPYLRLFAETAGGCMLADEALASLRLKGTSNGPHTAKRIAIARFFAENLTVQARALERAVIEGGDDIAGWDAALADTRP